MSAVATPAAPASAAIPHTNDTAGARRTAEGFARARAGGRSALIPYVVAGYPDADASFEIACAAIDAGADLLEVGLPYSDPLADGATLQRASQGALAAGATFDRLARAGRADRGRPPGRSDRAHGLCEPADRRRGWSRPGAGPGVRRRRRRDRRRPDPRRGPPFERVAAEAGIGVVYLVAPTTDPARRAAVAARSGGFLYCVSLVGVTGRAHVAAADGLAPRPRGEGGLAGAGRGRVRGLEGGPRPRDREGRCRRRDRGLGAGRCARPDGRDIAALSRLVTSLRAATAR